LRSEVWTVLLDLGLLGAAVGTSVQAAAIAEIVYPSTVPVASWPSFLGVAAYGAVIGSAIGLLLTLLLWAFPGQQWISPGALPGVITFLCWLAVAPIAWTTGWAYVSKLTIWLVAMKLTCSVLLLPFVGLYSYIVAFILHFLLVGIVGMPWPDRDTWTRGR
jgi:hypothetical protein